jgi:OTU domain-containing protein 6
VTRKTAAQYMREHKDDFIAFLPSIGGEDTAGATDDGMMDDAGFEKYCRMVAETGEWGGEPEVGLSSCFFFFPPSFYTPFLRPVTISLEKKGVV